MKITGYYTNEACIASSPPFQSDPKITKYVVEDEEGNTQIISPPLDPSVIEELEISPIYESKSVSKLEALLRIDPASGEKPVPILEWNEYFLIDHKEEEVDPKRLGSHGTGVYTRDGKFVGFHQYEAAPTPYNTSPHLVDKNGDIVGHFNSFELYNQAGIKIAKKEGRDIVRDGKTIGYLDHSKLHDKNGKLIAKSVAGCGKVFLNNRITANAAGKKLNALNDLFFIKDSYIINIPEFSSSRIVEMKKVVKEFKPETKFGKNFRKKLLKRLKTIEELRKKHKADPKKALIQSSDRLTKIVALWLLAEDKSLSQNALKIIETLAKKDNDPCVRFAAITVLGKIKKGLMVILDALEDKNREVKISALYALDNMYGYPLVGPTINHRIFESLFKTAPYRFRGVALKVLSKNDPAVVSKLIKIIEEKNSPPEKKQKAIEALRSMKAKDVEKIIPELPSYPPEIREDLVHAICDIRPDKIEALAEIALSDPNPEIRAALFCYSEGPNRKSFEALALKVLQNDRSEKVRSAAVNCLSYNGGIKTLSFIKTLLSKLQSKDIPKEEKEKLANRYGIILEFLSAVEKDESLPLLKAFLRLPFKPLHKGALEALWYINYHSPTTAFLLTLEYLTRNMEDFSAHKAWNILTNLDFNKNIDLFKKHMPEFRKLLSHKDCDIRAFGAETLIKLGENILPLLDEIDPALLDPQFLNSIGADIAISGNDELITVVYNNFQEAEDDAAFKRNTYLLLGILSVRKEKLKLFSNIERPYLDKLETEGANPSIQRVSVFALIKLIKLYDSPQKADKIANKLLQKKGPLEIFILRNLATARELLSPKIKALVENKINDILISKSPPYEEWFNKTKNPDKVIVAKVYFQLGQPMWELLLEKDDFKITKKDSKSMAAYFRDAKQILGLFSENDAFPETTKKKPGVTVREKKLNGVILRVVMVDISDEKSKLRTNIFQDLANPKIHYIGYNGHAGMGGNIEMKDPRKDDDPTPFGTKVVHVAACSSMSSYYPRVLKLAPNVQFVGNIIGSYSEDDAKVFISNMNGIAFQKSWEKINEDIKTMIT